MFEVKEKPKMVEKAFLIGIQQEDESDTEVEHLLLELEDLVSNMGIGIGGKQITRLKKANPRYLLGSGKAEELVSEAQFMGCDCIIFDVPISPAQQRNWEALSGLCVIDRQEVILDIFASRAITKEATLQVSLARMEYALPRLKNAWSHLSRQRGGGSVTQRGEGEKQIELDHRMIRQRIARLKVDLKGVIRHRQIQRKQRMRIPLPSAAIVGYTNAGKSTLLNQITGANVLAEDKLFATLDPTTRQAILPSGQKILLTDTVGFVRRLPHRLVEAFKATLEEAVVSNFLIHVIDASSPDAEAHQATTLELLEELGANTKEIITVYNKLDLCSPETQAQFSQKKDTLAISAQNGEGINELIHTLESILLKKFQTHKLLIPYDRYEWINKLHEIGAINHEKARDQGVEVIANLDKKLLKQLEAFIVT